MGAILGAGYAMWRFLATRTPDTGGISYRARPFPLPPEPVPASSSPGPTAEVPALAADPEAVEPLADGTCPASHPIKGKRETGIYHPPGAFAYERTRADRCYRDESAAAGDGLRAAKR